MLDKLLGCLHVSFYDIVCVLSSQSEHNETVAIQFDDTDGGAEEEHVTGGRVKQGEKIREERPGEVQTRREKKG